MSEKDRQQAKFEVATNAIESAVGILNMVSQRQLLGIDSLDPDLGRCRQILCEALSIIKGEVFSGDLTKTASTRAAMAIFDLEYPPE